MYRSKGSDAVLRERWRVKRTLGLAVLVAVATGLFWVAQDAGAAPTANVYAVDANPSAAGVQDTISVAVGADFTVDHVVVSAADAWSAEQSNMKFDPAIVRFVSGPVNTNLGGAVLCGETEGSDYVYGGCARTSGTTAATGATRSWKLHCAAVGTSALHLQGSQEVGEATGTNFAIAAGVGDSELQDAAVTCTSGTGGGDAQASRTAAVTATQAASAGGGANASSPRAGSGSNSTVSSRLISVLVVGSLAIAATAAGAAVWRRRNASSGR